MDIQIIANTIHGTYSLIVNDRVVVVDESWSVCSQAEASIKGLMSIAEWLEVDELAIAIMAELDDVL